MAGLRARRRRTAGPGRTPPGPPRRGPDQDLAAVAHALATTRSAFDHRAVVIGRRRPEFLRGLMALADGEEAPASSRARPEPAAGPRSCSRGRAPSAWAWASNSPRPTRASPRPSPRCARSWTRTWATASAAR
ncbi:hypothetical protein WKI68_11910 [Streptomyces sp. MS1.HAVA.3]|uniref:Uncharacterized protein n=1 Tax=Streptomyces caledonius TaxID=3134107 RepID=A0ABU8U271_9ACTN